MNTDGVPRVGAVIVSYQPDSTIFATVRALLDQVTEIVVVDNGSDGPARERVEALGDLPGVSLVLSGSNRGIAAAMNTGAAFGTDRGWDWIATFDQDSVAPPGFIDALLEAHAAYPHPDRVAIVGPSYVDVASGYRYSRSQKGFSEPFLPVQVTFTSGNLLKRSAFEDVGPFDEPFFIDYVDIEFCLRCRRNGYIIIEAPRAELHHRLGQSVRHRLGWRELAVTNHPPLRRYYNARNRVLVYRRYGLERPGWMLGDIALWVKEIVKVGLFEEDAGRKLAAMVRGVADAVWGRSGRAS